MSHAPDFAAATLQPVAEGMAADPYAITSHAALDRHYAAPRPLVLRKVMPALDATAVAFIERSPFCVLSTVGPRGVHGSPRGDGPGLVAVLDQHTLALPDRPGNNRLDALRDVVDDPRVAILFLVPGSGETLRVSGRGWLTADPALRARFAMSGREPATVLMLRVAEVYMQCRRAVARAALWPCDARPPGLPTAGEMLAAHTGGMVQADAVDAEMPLLERKLY